MSADNEALRAKYEALKELHGTTEQDVSELTARFDAVQDRLRKVRAENEYLIGKLCEYTPSDFESDQSDLERDEDLLDKKLPLPQLDKPQSAAAKSAARRRAEKSAARKRAVAAGKKKGGKAS